VAQRCNNCENPDSSLLRVILIGEIIRAEEADLYILAELFNELGLLELSENDNTPSDDPPSKRNLHRIK
jgi:hypothetical protein